VARRCAHARDRVCRQRRTGIAALVPHRPWAQHCSRRSRVEASGSPRGMCSSPDLRGASRSDLVSDKKGASTGGMAPSARACRARVPRTRVYGRRAFIASQACTSDGESPSTSDGESPTSDGESPTSDGESPTSDGESPTSDGESPTSDGESPTSDGESPTSKK
jgi:hypothetical protein